MDKKNQLNQGPHGLARQTKAIGSNQRNGSQRLTGAKGIALSLCIMLLVMLSFSFAEVESQASLRLIQSDATHVVLELESPNYLTRTQRVAGASFAAFEIPGLGSSGEVGKPALPIRGTFVAIPPGARPTLKVLVDDSRRDAVTNQPLPVPSQRVQINPLDRKLTSASITYVPDPKTYSANQLYPAEPAIITQVGNWRSERFALVEFYPLQYSPATHQIFFHKRLRVEISFGDARGVGADSVAASVDEGAFESVIDNTFVNYESAKTWRSKMAPSAFEQRSPSYSGGAWYKITISSDGMYKITCDQLRAAGVDVAALDPSTLQIFKQGSELAVQVLGVPWSTCDANDYVEFFGNAIVSKYSTTNIYWLTFGKQAGKRMTFRNGTGSTATTTFTNMVHLEQDLYYMSNLPPGDDKDHWLWEYIAPAFEVSERTYHMQAANFVTSGISPTLVINMAGWSNGGHHTQASINGHLIMDSSWAGASENWVKIPFDQTFLLAADNTIEIVEQDDLDPNDLVFTNYLDLVYPSAFSTASDSLRFQQPHGGAWRYDIAGFSSSQVDTFDVSDPFNVVVFGNATLTGNGPYALHFSDTVTNWHDYIAISPSQLKSPVSITRDVLSDLHNPNNRADEIIIAYGSLLPYVQPLADYRKSQGLQVKLVDVQDVYDEFSDGVMDPKAIREFLSYAYAVWQSPAPSFVLLVGNGTWDPKGNCATPGVCPGLTTPPGSTLIPAYLRWVDPWIGETASDNRFVSFDDATGNTLPFMAIGRLPVETVDQVTAMASKIVNYEASPTAGDWRSKLLFVAGMPDDGGAFWTLSDGVVDNMRYVPDSTMADRIYYGRAPYADAAAAKSAIISTINTGRLVVNYIGHGSTTAWAADSNGAVPLLNASDASGLSNAGKLPVILAMTCLEGYFIQPDMSSVAEEMVRAPNGGALASWSPSGWGYAQGHDFLDKGFLESVFWSGSPSLGRATMNGKLNLWLNGSGDYRDLIDTFNLLGDPASRLNVPPRRIFMPLIGK